MMEGGMKSSWYHKIYKREHLSNFTEQQMASAPWTDIPRSVELWLMGGRCELALITEGLFQVARLELDLEEMVLDGGHVWWAKLAH